MNKYCTYGLYNVIKIYQKLLNNESIHDNDIINNYIISDQNFARNFLWHLFTSNIIELSYEEIKDDKYKNIIEDFISNFYKNSIIFDNNQFTIKDRIIFNQQTQYLITLLNQELDIITDMRYEWLYNQFKIVTDTILSILDINAYDIDNISSITYYTLAANAFREYIRNNNSFSLYTYTHITNNIIDIDSLLNSIDQYFNANYNLYSFMISETGVLARILNDYIKPSSINYMFTLLNCIRMIRVKYSNGLDLAIFFNVDYNDTINERYINPLNGERLCGLREYIIVPISQLSNFTYKYYSFHGNRNSNKYILTDGFHMKLKDKYSYKAIKQLNYLIEKYYGIKNKDIPYVTINTEDKGNELDNLLIESKYIYGPIYNDGNIESLDKLLTYYINKESARETLELYNFNIKGERFRMIVDD